MERHDPRAQRTTVLIPVRQVTRVTQMHNAQVWRPLRQTFSWRLHRTEVIGNRTPASGAHDRNSRAGKPSRSDPSGTSTAPRIDCARFERQVHTASVACGRSSLRALVNRRRAWLCVLPGARTLYTTTHGERSWAARRSLRGHLNTLAVRTPSLPVNPPATTDWIRPTHIEINSIPFSSP